MNRWLLLVLACFGLTRGVSAAEPDPYRLFEAGDYAEALPGLQDLQARNPNDLDLLERLGTAHYRLGDFEAARRAFAQLLERAPEELQTKALYNLANAEVRSGQLLGAAQHYREVLERAPENDDARHNLEVVERLMRTPPPPPPRDGESEEPRDGEGSEQDSDASKGQDGQPGDNTPSDEDAASADERQKKRGPKPRRGDRDGDGIPNRVERRSKHGSDPAKPDTDGDGILDGDEDLDRDGEVDPGETDPTEQDTDGDGIPDGRDPKPTEANRRASRSSPSDGLSPDEAERYLRALDERPPMSPLRRRSGVMQEKDW